MIEPDVLEGLEAFLEERRSGITSTDVPGILGLSKWATPLSVYRDKVGESQPRPVTLPMWMGNRLEGIVSELYTEATGNRVRADNRLIRHPIYDWFICHLDRRVVGDPDLIVELKTRDRMTGWGEDGTDKVPPDVFCQVQSQMIVTAAREAHVATLFSNRSFRVYRILPDPDFAAKLIPTLEDFWFNYVVAGVPPEPSGREIDTEVVNATPGGNTGHIKAATPEQEEVAKGLKAARLNAAVAELAKDAAENRVKTIIGEDADGLTGSFGTIYWKRVKDSHKTKWEVVAGVYKAAVDALLELADQHKIVVAPGIRTQVDAAKDLYTKIEPGTRRLDVRFKDEDE